MSPKTRARGKAAAPVVRPVAGAVKNSAPALDAARTQGEAKTLQPSGRQSEAEGARAIAEVRALDATGQIQAVIDRASAALARDDLAPEQRAELLSWRSENLMRRAETALADADADALDALARRTPGNATVAAWALRRRGAVQGRSGNADESLATLWRAHHEAGNSGEPMLQALCMQALAGAMARLRQDLPGALQLALDAADRFETLGMTALQARALASNAGQVLQVMGRAAEADDMRRRALVLARQCGDLSGQIHTLNGLSLNDPDYAALVGIYRQIIDLARSIGDLSALPIFNTNLAITYGDLGLFRRARRLTVEAITAGAAVGNRALEAGGLGQIADDEVRLRHADAARETSARAAALAREIGARHLYFNEYYVPARLALQAGQPAEAARLLERAIAVAAEQPEVQMSLLPELARAWRAAGRPHARRWRHYAAPRR